MSNATRNNRRARLVRFGVGLVAAGAVLSASIAPGVLAQALQQPRTQIVDATAGETQTQVLSTTVGQTTSMLALTVSQTEGPYFKANSPERTTLVDDTTQGTLLTITGQVLDVNGTPVGNALLDFWQANDGGQYDNSGYNMRGHQYTDENGNFTLTTVVPGLYPGRTRHIHVKVQAPNGPILTTQLYFPGEARNNTDGIYDPSLLLNTQSNADGSESATFNFVVATG
jgi:protocatechuate 3,4-dioxygenase beta subunit